MATFGRTETSGKRVTLSRWNCMNGESTWSTVSSLALVAEVTARRKVVLKVRSHRDAEAKGSKGGNISLHKTS